jgi:hypothetical protein
MKKVIITNKESLTTKLTLLVVGLTAGSALLFPATYASFHPVTTGEIADDTIRSADISNTAGVNSVDIVNGQVGSVDIGTGQVASVDIRDGQVGSVDIGDGQVASADILDGTITSQDIASGTIPSGSTPADNSVTSAKIADGEVKSVDIGNDEVFSVDIGDGQVGSVDIGSGQVASEDIGDGQVGSVDIGDGQVATADLASSAIRLDISIEKKTVNNIPPGTISIVIVDCPPGKIVAGGGFNAFHELQVFESHPPTDDRLTGWMVEAKNLSTTTQGFLQAVALCIDPTIP